MRGFVCLLLLLILSLKTTTTGAETLECKMRGLILRPDRDVLNLEKEIKKIQFDKYQETSFHDSSSGIKVDDWDEVVNAIANDYDIPDKKVSQLKTAKLMDYRKANVYDFDIDGGKFAYIQIVVAKDKDGLMSYILVGTQVDFRIKQLVPSKTTVELLFHKLNFFANEEVDPEELKNRLRDYFLFKAQVSAGLHYGFKDDRYSDSCRSNY